MNYKETIKERVDVLPEQLKVFVLDKNWRKETEKVGNLFGLDEEKYASFENEVFLVLLCFEPKKDLADNIKKELGVDGDLARQMSERVHQVIFSKVDEDLKKIEKQLNENEERSNIQNGVGQAFERIIQNQAKAMQPAREAGGSIQHPAPSGQVENRSQDAATKTNGEERLKVTHNYGPGQDPYREPLG